MTFILHFYNNELIELIKPIIPIKFHQKIIDEIVKKKIYIDDHVKYMINVWKFDTPVIQNMLAQTMNKIHAEHQTNLIQQWYNTGNYELFNDIEEIHHKMIYMYTIRNESNRFSTEMIKFMNDNFDGTCFTPLKI